MTANTKQRPAVVVVGLDGVTGLQTARVFARKGVPVVGVAGNPKHFCCRTRFCSRLLTADINGPELIERLAELGPSLSQKAVLVPCTDNSVLQIAWNRSRLEEWYHIALPAADIVEMLADKETFPQFAAEHGFRVPKVIELSSRVDARNAAASVAWPAVLKPPVKTPLWLANTRRKAIVVRSAEQLIDAFDSYSRWSEKLLLQEWIPGKIENHYTCNAYFNRRSEALAAFTSQKLRQWPAETGIGSLSCACEEPEVTGQTSRLFQAAGFFGLAYLEIKRHGETGDWFILEANVGRPTGRSASAEASGVELLYTLYCDQAGLPLPAARQQSSSGQKWIYWKRDLYAAWHAWRAGDLTFSGWFRSVRGRKSCAVFSLRDPKPFLFDWFRIRKQFAARRKTAERLR